MVVLIASGVQSHQVCRAEHFAGDKIAIRIKLNGLNGMPLAIFPGRGDWDLLLAAALKERLRPGERLVLAHKAMHEVANDFSWLLN